MLSGLLFTIDLSTQLHFKCILAISVTLVGFSLKCVPPEFFFSAEPKLSFNLELKRVTGCAVENCFFHQLQIQHLL